jgi:hypothetical protein
MTLVLQRPRWESRYTTTTLMSSWKCRLTPWSVILKFCWLFPTQVCVKFISWRIKLHNQLSDMRNALEWNDQDDNLQFLDFFKKNCTAVSSPRCSQRPSEANIRNRSLGFSLQTWVDGSMLRAGLFNGIGGPISWNNRFMVYSCLLK